MGLLSVVSEAEKQKVAGFCMGAAIMILVMSVATYMSKQHALRCLRNEAVKQGVAKWVADEEGEVRFEWIPPAEKEK